MTGEQFGGCLVAVVTGVLGFLLAFEAFRRCRLRLRGVSTTAELVRFRTAVAEDGDLLYYPVVVFTLPNGVEIEAEGEGVSHPPHGTREGDRTEVVYDPAVPSSVVLPSLLPGRLKIGEILAYCFGSIALGLVTYQILVDTF